MGRLMDKDELIKYVYDTYGIGSGQATNKECFDIICHIYEAPTVEAIPKADYENRLKADMTAILEEVRKQLKDMRTDFYEQEHKDISFGINIGMEVIQQKIEQLKGVKQ